MQTKTYDRNAISYSQSRWNLLVASFDESAWVKQKGEAYHAIIWKLPKWIVVAAASEFTIDLTMNEAE